MIKLNNFYISESVKFMKENIPDNFIDLTVTSPPYDNLRNYNGFVFDYKSMLQELYRITKVGGVVVWIVCDATISGSETGTSFEHALYAKKIGLNIHDTMIYGKENYVPLTHNRYEQQFEYMFIFTKNKPRTCNLIKIPCVQSGKVKKSSWSFDAASTKENSSIRSGKTRKDEIQVVNNTKIKPNIWFYNVGKNLSTKDKIAFKHPAVFPEQLVSDHILSWSNEEDIVFDPMCGSGTTCKMAYLNNRKFIGVDMSEEYINQICIPRLEQYGWCTYKENEENESIDEYNGGNICTK